MKQKKLKKKLIVLLCVIFAFFAGTFAQYYYFDSGGNTYQQGCSETVSIRINSEGEPVRAGRFHLILNPNDVIYSQTGNVSVLRSFFIVSNQTFQNRSSEASPSWKSGSNYTVLQADRNNAETDYIGTNGLYANVKFTPVFRSSTYTIDFGMEYKPGSYTTETTLSKLGGTELINPQHQALHLTGTFQVLQEPCAADTNKPTISNISISNGSTKNSYLSGLSFSLKDEVGVNGVQNVPYIWTNGSWTGNVGGTISNQYGIPENGYTLKLSGNGQSKTITNTMPGVHASWDGKTWQNYGLNANITIDPEGLFDFGIEKKITATFTFNDRAENTNSQTITFNAPQGPTLISNSRSPADGAVYVNLSDPVKLGIKDDWAGVNSGTIKITLSGVNGTDYGPYEFTGSALNLSGVQGGANTPDYYINITGHEQFPTSGTIRVSVYAEDMEGNVDTISDYTFTTRPNCSEFQCCDPVLLDLGSGNTTYYTNTGLIISGGVNPTFSGDEQNITGVVDCNTENEGLSVYTGDDNFMFFTDESELTILGTGVKGVLSGNVLTLSYIIDSAEIIVDKPSSGQILTTGDVDIRWHLTGVDDEDGWLSGYYIEIYSGDTLITGGFVDGTGITESLSDGEYEFVVYPVDLGGHTGSAATGTFSIDTVVPSVVITGNDVGMCSPAGTIYTITGIFSEAVTGIDASTLTVTSGRVQNFKKVSNTEFVWTVRAGENGVDSLSSNVTSTLFGNGTTVTHNPDAGIHYVLNSGFDTEQEFTAGIIIITDGTTTITMLDRNLGATAAGTGCEDNTNNCPANDPTYGYHFQRGNNYGFDPNSTPSTSSIQVQASLLVYNPLQQQYFSNSTFIIGNYNWLDDGSVVDLWGGSILDSDFNYNLGGTDQLEFNDDTRKVNSEQVVQRRGPCPEGFHVPSEGELLKVISMVEDIWVSNYDLLVPFAGYRDYNDAELERVGGYASFWSSSPGNYGINYGSESFGIGTDRGVVETDFRATALPVRCFYDSYETYNPSSDLPSESGTVRAIIDTGAFEDLAGNRNTTGTDELSWDYDGEGPEFTLEDVEIPECTDGTMIISGVTQIGCASGHESPYSWDAGDTWGLTSTNTAYSGGIGEKIMTVRVRDAFGNYTEKTGKYTWTNVNPSVDDISVENVGLGTGINWRELSNAHEGTCGTGTIGFSGFIDDGSHGTCTEEGGIITYVANTDTEYEGGDSCIFEITDDDGYTATGMITFTGIDTKKPTCSISYNENVCTSGDIALTMSATGAAEYSWNGFTSMVIDNLPHNVNGNGVYTGYVRDNVGNTGICTVEVETFDDVLPIITIPAPAALTAEECTIIEGNIQVVDNGGCGNGFSYLWGGFGLGNDLSYSGYSEVVTGKMATVSVGDPAGNIANGTLNYTRTDTGVQLNFDEKIISDIVLTGGNSYNTTTGDLISLFGAREGNCGEKYISVSKISCNGLSMDIDAEGNVVVTGNNNLTQTGSCELRFSDDDGNSENGTLKIRVDTVVPGVEIQGTNLACMSGSSFVVTGIFTELVQGFDVGSISVENGTPSNLLGNGSGYTWTVNMNPNVEVKVKVPAGAAFDLNGNPNTESNELTGMYDTAGPNKVILSERTKVYSETSKFTWQSVSDSGCAGVSGYIRELYEGSCEGTPKDSGITGAENFTVSGLENSGSYCRRVRSVDNFGNMGEWSDGDEFVVDLSDIGCDFDYVQACTNGTVQVTLQAGDDYTNEGDVRLSRQDTGDWYNVSGLTTGVTYSGQTLIGYIYQPNTDKFNSCEFVATTIDTVVPQIISVDVESASECTTGTATVVEISDEGCGQGTYTYSWNGGQYGDFNSFQKYLSESGTQIINLKVKDNAGNESAVTGVTFTWTDSPISGNNFTGYTNVGNTGRTINWRDMSHVSDGACGSETIEFSGFVNSGTKGTCTTGEGDMIIYTPNPNEIGDDSCTIQVKDDEGGTKDIVISWEGIDTKGPSCSVSKQPEACVSGSVVITLQADEEISSAEGGNISRGISGTNATGVLDVNSTFDVEIKDLVGNTGICNVKVTNIYTGVLDAPVRLSPANGSNTNDNTLTLSWSGVSVKGCRYPSGYEVQIIPSGGDAITGFTTVNEWTTPDLADGEYIIKVKTIDNLGGESEWTGITITIDTEKPTCEIQYDNACISGNVQLTMITTGADFYSWTNFSDMSESLAPNDVSSNGTYDCFVKDLAGNTGTNSTLITNIKTGVLSDPSNLAIVGGTPTNDNTPEFTWSKPDNDGCREVSGYAIQILSGGDPIDIIPVDGTGWTPSSPLPDGEYTIIIKTEDTLSGVSEGTGITFVVDTSAPNCSIEVMTANCTNSGVEIKLSGDISDILTYGWWNGMTGNFGNNITTIVNQNGEYTGYVYDEAGNEGVCVGVVGTGIQDQILISYTTNDAVGFECEVITGSIVGNTGDSCGKDDLSKFTYSRPGGINTSEYGTSSNNVLSGFGIQVTIVDGAGNSNTDTVKYTWNDTGVTLSNGASQSIDDVLTGTFEKAVAEIVDMFGATEGACGTGNITVTGTICSGASISIENGIISINPDADLDGVDGYCEFEFGDNEGEKTTTGKVMFIVDTKQPGVTLTGTNLVCMNTDTFDVTGTFTEAMMGFELGDVNVSGGTVSNFNGNGSEYTWKVHMTPMVETTVFVPAGVATDLNGNENTESNKLIGMYDNVGPNDVSFVNWQDEIYLKNPTIFRNAVSDQGCAGLSGYNWVLSNGNSCNNIVDSGFTTNLFVNLDNLSHEATYTLCVQTVDNFGNTGNRATGGFYVDLNAVGCMFEETECSNVGITLKLKPSNPDWTGIYLSWTGDGYREDEPFLTQYVDEPGKTVVGYVYQTGDNPKQSSCTYTVQKIDKSEPTITSFVDVSVPECTTGDLNIIATDEGCGNTGLYYSWDNSEFALNSTIYSLWSGKAGSKVVDVQIKDNVGNTVSGSATIEWTDSPISGNDITVENVGRGSGVNWRELSEVSDGACGSGTIEIKGIVEVGTHGICTTGEGDTIIYTPDITVGYTGEDSCEIEVEDDEGDTGSIVISWGGIDTEKPSCILTVQEGQDCTSGTVTLSLSSESEDVEGYSFDGENRREWTGPITTGRNAKGTYTGYVKDAAGNISDPCTVEVTGGILDLDEPGLETMNWTGYECSTGSITVTGTDNSCGLSGLNYLWSWSENTNRTNEIYSGNVGSQIVNVSVYDGVGHSITEQVTYTWQNVPVTGNDFVVENVGTGITVDWFVNGNVSGGICELDDIEAISSNTGICEISGHEIIYTPIKGVQGGESCTITITDQDEEGSGDIEIEITFTGVDTRKPTVTLEGGVGEQCTSGNRFTVTGRFDEEVTGVTIDTLTGENVEIKGFNDIDGKVYEWIVEMQGGTGKVWINSGEVSDLIGNEMDAVAEFVLGNYDNLAPIIGSGISPSLGQTLLSTSFTFEWDESVDQGCAGEITYILQICEDEECENADSYSVSGTGKTVGSLENGTGYWRVISEDAYGNTGVTDIQNFVVDARQPTCSIEPLQMCTTGNVGLVLTVDRDVTIENNGGVDWIGTGKNYTGEVSENGEIVVVVRDVAVVEYTGRCEINVTGHDSRGPEITQVTGATYECEGATIQINAVDSGCAGISGYNFGLEFGNGEWQVGNTLEISSGVVGRTGGIKEQEVTVEDTLGNSSKATGYVLEIKDREPTFDSGDYVIGLITGNIGGIDIISEMGVREGACGAEDLIVEMGNCTYVTGILMDKVLTISPDDNIEEAGECEIYIKDNEGNIATGYISYQVDTQAPNCEIIYDTTEITNQDVTATLSCSGTSGENWFATTGEVILTGDGEVIFEFKDENGNTGSITGIVDWIDKTAPECSIEYSPNTPTSGNVTGMLVGCTEPITVTNTSGNVSIYVFENTGTFTFEFVDEAGNTGEAIATVDRIDKDAPTCTVNVPEGRTNTGVTLTMDVVGDATGYSWNDVDWLGTNTGLFVENTGIYTGYVRDEVWNVEICTGLVERIDKQRPTITLEGTNISGCTNESTFVVTGIFTESVSGFTQDKISITNGNISDFMEVELGTEYTWTVTMTGGELTLYVATGVVVDKAGNTNDASNILKSNYDNAGPGSVVITRPSNGINYGSTLILQWNAVEDQGCIGVSGYVYKICEDLDCNTVVSGGTTDGTGVKIEDLGTGTYYWIVYPEDKYGNTGDETTGQVFVDLTRIGCRFEETTCSNTGVILSMFIDGSGTHLSWTGEGYWEPVTSLSIEINEPSFSITGFVFDEETNRSGYCEYTVNNIDQINPTITSVVNVTGYECETITGSFVVTDEGCGSGLISYIWDGLDGTNSFEYGLFNGSGNTGRIVYVTGYDGVRNNESTGVSFRWLNSPITWNDFTGNEYVGSTGRSVNWKSKSNVSDGACGSGTVNVVGFINSGSKGECTVEGDIVTYTPREGQTGSDICVLKVEDDEYDTGSIIITWSGIDTVTPSVEISGSDVGMCVPASTTYVVTGIFSENVIFGESIGGVNGGTLTTLGGNTWDFSIIGNTGGVWTIKNDSTYIYEEAVDGINTLTICDPSNSTSCITMMDRNLGAITDDITSTGSYGYHYQWGNNHGFESCYTTDCDSFPGGETTGTGRITNANQYGPNTSWYSGSTFITSYTSFRFISQFDWANPKNDNLWGGENDSRENNRGLDFNNPADRQGPCDTGYHVPSIGERNKVLEYWAEKNGISLYNNESNGNNGGLFGIVLGGVDTGLYYYSGVGYDLDMFQDDFNLSFAGYRDYDGKVHKTNQIYLWSSSPAGNYARVFSLILHKNNNSFGNLWGSLWGLDNDNSDEINISNTDARINAYSIRCFKNEPIIPSSKNIGTLIAIIETGVFKDSVGNFNSTASNELSWFYDGEGPEFTLDDVEVEECIDGTMAISGVTQVGCASGHVSPYSWDAGNTWGLTGTNTAYSGGIGEKIMTVRVRDAFGNYTEKTGKYTRTNVNPSVDDISVENVGLGTGVNWMVLSNAHEGECGTGTIEFSGFIDDGSHGTCTEEGGFITYVADTEYEGEDSCIFEITDDEGYTATGVIAFTGVDTLRPTVGLQGGIGEQCTNENTFTVTGVFDEVVQGVNIGTLTGENVNIVDFTGNEDIYEWTVEMQGGTGRVWILTGGITDNVGNELMTGDEKILGNYDNENPQGVTLLSPGTGQEFNRRTIDFEWTVSSDEGCAGLSGYIVNVCRDSSCNDVVETISTGNTGVTITLQDNDDYYWRVIPVDNNGNGNTGVSREFSVQSDEPVCSIVSSECSSSPVSLMLTGNKEIFIVSGNVTWQQVSPAVYTSEISENIDVWTIVRDSDGQTGYCHTGVESFDNAGPDFEFGTIEVDEGQPLNITIVANDTGCAEISGYSFGTEFGSGEWQTSSGLSITAEQIGNIGGIEKDQVVSVIDTLGNITTKTGKIVIKDVKPTITQTGTIDGVQTGEVIVDIIDLLGAEEGDLGTGDLEVEIDECVYATGYVSGHNLIVNVEDDVEGIGYCVVKIKDNEGSYSDVDGVIEFEVDTKEPVCTGLVFNPAGWTSGDSVSVSLTGCSEPIYSGDTTFVFTGNGDHTFEFEDDMGNTGEVVVHFTGFDREGPSFDFNNNSGYECETGTLTISNTVDAGIGLADSPYSFDGTTRNTLNTKQIYSGGAGEILISGYVRDKLGNYKVVQAEYVFNDSKPTATGFSIYALSGIEVNWKDLSNASDGACGSGKLIASVSGGTASGNCSISGDVLLYESEFTATTLINTCDLIISDDEGNNIKITVEIKGINNYPDVELVTPINGLVLDPGNVKFAWRGQGNSEVIDKYVYNIWSSNDDYTVEQTGVEVSIDLRPGAYRWNVYAKYIDTTTGGLSDTYSFNVVSENSGLAKDKCPNGDFSDSFYDGRCDPSGSHSAADICGAASSNYSDELKGAYVYAYSYGITTMCPIDTANLDGYLIRSHFAKMISEFAVNVLGKKPEKGKTGCDKFNDIDGLNKELHDFVITSCELNLMGQESDGITPAKSFNPNDYVTRAQFGTVLSRLLFGDVYNIKDESKVYMNEGFWYKNHLEALKNYGIMTKIDGDWPNTLERRGRVMLMLERADEYGIFAGKIPAKNGIKALFDE